MYMQAYMHTYIHTSALHAHGNKFGDYSIPWTAKLLLYFMYHVRYSIACYNLATGCYMIINNFT